MTITYITFEHDSALSSEAIEGLLQDVILNGRVHMLSDLTENVGDITLGVSGITMGKIEEILDGG